jgi:NAD+ kinase
MLPPNVTIKIVLWTKKKCATVTLDGQGSHIVKPGGTIEVKKSNDYINLVDSPYRDYLEILRTKLGWGGLP